MAKNRYVGDYPVIGIRPTIDGRRGVLGVRESLEVQTMNMARAAAKLFEENLKYSDGTPVKVGRVEKMSKSKGNVIYADDMVNRFGTDAVRYYLLSEQRNRQYIHLLLEKLSR